MLTAQRIWLQAFAICPAPCGPKCVMRFPRTQRTSRAFSRSALSPPTRSESVPSRARNSMPVTGESRKPILLAPRAAPISRATDGWIVVMSTTTVPSRAPWTAPSGPRITAFTAAESVTIVITKSAPSAAARGEAAWRAPAATSSAAFDGSRFHTARRFPASSSRRAIARPMIPRPMNPTLRAMRPPGRMSRYTTSNCLCLLRVLGHNQGPMSAALFAAAALLQIQVRDEPKDWKLITTDHFNVYYPSEDLLPRAREFASWFERARAELSQTMGVEPERVHVFLYRSFHDLEQSSFLATSSGLPLSRRLKIPMYPDSPVPARRLPQCRLNSKSRALALSEPLRNRIFIHCQASDLWNYWFIKHELAHQVQFEHLFPFRLPSWMIALKDPITPEWWWEGGADYWAGVFESEKDAYVRDLADERLYDLKELFSPDILNPYDQIAIYYEGSYFWRFLDEEYGAGSGRRLFERTSHGIPIASQKPVQAVVGKSRVE